MGKPWPAPFGRAGDPDRSVLGMIAVRKSVALLILAGYLALLLYLTLFQGLNPGARPNLLPLRMIGHYLKRGGWGMVVNIWGNLAAFVPLGLLAPAISPRERSAWRVARLGLMLSGGIEFLQFLSGRRVADVDDLLLNVLGALIGYCGWRVWRWSVARVRLRVEPSA